MIQFNLNRFGRLLKWTMIQDKSYYLKNFLQVLAIALLGFIFFLFVANYGNGDSLTKFHQSYAVTAGMMLAFMFIYPVLGPCSMFHSMKGKHNRQTLMLLPASNFEKYLVRYMTWVIMWPMIVVAVLLADVIQYGLHWMLGYEYYQLVFTKLIEILSGKTSFGDAPQHIGASISICCLWLHSFYMFGATFFRSRKFSFIYTTFLWIAVSLLIVWIFPNWGFKDKTPADYIVIGNIIYTIWAIINVWLSYRCFCRTQVMGRFVNL